MKQELDLTPFRFAWRGALGGLAGTLAATLFIGLTNPDPMVIIYLLPLSLISIGLAAAIGAVSGFIIGLFYTEGMKVGFALRLLIWLGISLFSPVVVVILLSGNESSGSWTVMARLTIFATLIIGLLLAIVATPWVISKQTKGEVQ